MTKKKTGHSMKYKQVVLSVAQLSNLNLFPEYLATKQ